MIVHRHGVALEALSVLHRLHFPFDRLVLDLAVGLAQPVAVGVDTLLAGFAVLPHLVTLRYPGQAQTVGQDLSDKGPMRQTVGKADHHCGALFREAKHARTDQCQQGRGQLPFDVRQYSQR